MTWAVASMDVKEVVLKGHFLNDVSSLNHFLKGHSLNDVSSMNNFLKDVSLMDHFLMMMMIVDGRLGNLHLGDPSVVKIRGAIIDYITLRKSTNFSVN